MPENNGNHDYKLKMAEWRGGVTQSLADIDKQVMANGERIEKLDKKVERLSDKMVMLQVKVAGISALTAFVTALIFYYLKTMK